MNERNERLTVRLMEVVRWLGEHDEVDVSSTWVNGHGASIDIWPGDEAEVRAVLRSLGGKWEKIPLDSLMVFRQTYNDITVDVNISRTAVCEKVITERVEVPACVVPAHVEEKFEWRCRPILTEDGNEQ